MNKLVPCLVVLFVSSSSFLVGQTVKTLHRSPFIQDGLFVTPDGNVFTTCGGLVGKRTIGMYSPKTKQFNVVTRSMNGTIDIVSPDGNLLYATNYDDNTVKCFNRKTEKTKRIASGLDGPSGIEIDKSGNLYVASYGAGPTYDGNTVWKIKPDGSKERLIQSDQIFQPQGLAWFDDETLLVSNSAGGKLFTLNVKTREFKLFTNTGFSHGHIAVGRGHIYIASGKQFRILELDMKGAITSTFGTGKKAGLKNGPAKKAEFTSPLGLAFGPDENKLYISEISIATLRVIEFDE